MFILIITIPFGVAALRIGIFAFVAVREDRRSSPGRRRRLSDRHNAGERAPA